jgi:hypothetical protein
VIHRLCRGSSHLQATHSFHIAQGGTPWQRLEGWHPVDRRGDDDCFLGAAPERL